MRKYIFLLLSLLALNSFAQNNWEIKPSNQCENRWVAYSKGDDISIIGFLYMDIDRGLVLNHVGGAKKGGDGKFTLKKETKKEAIFNVNGLTNVYLIPDEVLVELGLPKTPKWLETYQRMGAHEIRGQYYWGRSYYRNGMYEKSLSFFKKVEAQDPNYKIVQGYLALIYLNLKKYSEALPCAKQYYASYPNDCFAMSVLGRAEARNFETTKAVEMYNTMIEKCTSKRDILKQQLAADISFAFLKNKDQESYNHWKKIALNYKAKNDLVQDNLESYFKKVDSNMDKIMQVE
ncbi:tetratricopeptide repeat protein [Ornithobacterium rhinotracheale]